MFRGERNYDYTKLINQKTTRPRKTGELVRTTRKKIIFLLKVIIQDAVISCIHLHKVLMIPNQVTG